MRPARTIPQDACSKAYTHPRNAERGGLSRPHSLRAPPGNAFLLRARRSALQAHRYEWIRTPARKTATINDVRIIFREGRSIPHVTSGAKPQRRTSRLCDGVRKRDESDRQAARVYENGEGCELPMAEGEGETATSVTTDFAPKAVFSAQGKVS